MRHRTKNLFTPTLVVLSAFAASADGAVLIEDEFNDASLNTDIWKLPDPGPGSFLGRTQLRTSGTPQLVEGVARLRLDTFNDGSSFLGSEIMTIEKFGLGTGLAFETRSRLVVPPGGVVGSLFTFEFNNPVRDEIDVELLGNEVQSGQQRVLTNVFDDDGFDTGGDGAFVSIPGIDLAQFNTYRVEWRPDRIDWFVNGAWVRTEFDTVPDAATNVRLNFWAPAADFGGAYDPALQPAVNAQQNRAFFYEVDRVQIESLGPRPNVLANAGFEAGDTSGGDLAGADGWFSFNDAFTTSSVSANTGTQAFKAFGPFTDGGGAGVGQDGFAAAEGQVWEAAAFLRNDASDPIGEGNFGVVLLQFLDDSGSVIATFDSPEVEAGDPGDVWLRRAAQGVAPIGTVEVQILLLHVQLDPITGGSVFFDDASLIRIPEPASGVFLLTGLITLMRRRAMYAWAPGRAF